MVTALKIRVAVKEDLANVHIDRKILPYLVLVCYSIDRVNFGTQLNTQRKLTKVEVVSAG